MSSVNIPAGTGFDAPKVSVTGDTAEEVRTFLLEASGLTDQGQTLLQLTIEAGVIFQGLAKLASDAEKQKAKPKKESVSKPTPPEVTEPSEVVESIDGQILAVDSKEKLDALYKSLKNNGWTDEHTALAVEKKQKEGWK